MTPPAETIAAVATPPGRGGVGIVRVSGPAAAAIARGTIGRLPEPRRATYCTFRDEMGRAIDQGIALYFPSPRSFTGEEVLELQGHGGPVVMDLLLSRVLALGARLARPGEFSERAFLNDRLDLAQAEAVADLIDADSELAARAALHSLQGEFSGRARALAEAVTALRVYIEAGIDFADEELDLLGDGEVARRAAELRRQLGELRAAARQGTILREGMTVVIAGRPNAGKSSLLNRLAGRESAIVTELPGTTRDILRERIAIDGMPLHVIDTAGLREATDRIEQEGIRRAWAEIERADRLLLVVDDAAGIGTEERAIVARLPQRLAVTVVRNKIDLTGLNPGRGEGELGEEILLSAREEIGIDLLRDHLKAAMGYRVGSSGGEGLFTARRRHLEALERADSHLGMAAERIAQGAGELVAEELRLAHRALGGITGAVTSDELLGRIFSTFCIGK